MNALSDEARALIDGVLKHDDPTQADKARVRTRLTAELGAAAFATLALTAASAGGTALAAGEAGTAGLSASGKVPQSTSWSLLSKLSLSGAALAVAGALWLSGGEPKQHEARSQRVAPQEKVAPAPVSMTTAAPRAKAVQERRVDEAAAAEISPAREGATKRSAARKVAASEAEAPAAPAPATAPSTLGQELKMLAEAQAALRSGVPERALALAAQHRASFPDGVMKEERQGIEALAGCALGRDYRAQAEAFLRSAQSSPLAARVRKACGIEP